MKKILLLFFLMTFSLGYSQPGASPTDPIVRNAWDVQSVYSDSYTNQTGVSFLTFGGSTINADFTPPGGTPAKYYTGHSYSGIQVNTAGSLDVSAMTHLHFDVYSPNYSSMAIKLESSSGTARELAVTGSIVPSSTTRDQWISIDLALSTYNTGNILTSLKYIVPVTFGQNATLYIDNVYFYRPATANPPPTISGFTVPTKVVGDADFNLAQPTSNSLGAWTYTSDNTSVATVSGTLVHIVGAGTAVITATQAADGIYTSGSTTASLVVTPPAATSPPARNAWDVVSFYSGSYTNSSTPTWGGSANSDISIGGNTTRYLSGLTSAQIAFAATDVSSMTHLHIDVYSINQANLWFWLMSQRVDLPTPINGWTSIDIPLSTYSGLGINLTNINLFRIENPTGAVLPAKNVYVDNIYFYRAATLQPPTLGSFTVPSKIVGDAPFTLTAPTSNSSGAWTFTSSNTNVATISGTTVTVVGGGVSTITATQASDGTYGVGTKTAQLSVLPLAAPIPPVRVATDVISYYSDSYTLEATPTWASSSSNSDVSLGGNNARFVSTFTFGQIAFANKNVSAMSHIHVDVYSLDATLLWLWVGTNRKDINVTPNSWTSIDIPLSQYSAIGVNLASVNIVKIENPLGAGTLRNMYVDNIYFYYTPTVPTISNFSAVAKIMGAAPFTLNATSTSPAPITYTSSNEAVATIIGNTVTVVGVGSSTLTASQVATGSYTAGSATATLNVTASSVPLAGPTAPPVRNYWDAYSVFSDEASYTVVPGTRNYNPGWGQAGTGTVTTAGTDNVWRASNLNYQGIVFGSNVDVSAMTTFHVDVWTFDETSLQFFQISNTTGERSVALTPLLQGQWNSYDIPMTAWTNQSGFTATALKEFKIVGSGGKTVYLDNMYFYRAATTLPPTLSAFTVPAKVVGDTPFTLNPPTSNNNPATFTYSSSNTNVATISGSTVTIVGAGTSTITATQDASGGYGTNTITATLTVTPPAAPTPPARNNWDVISLYSDSYATSSSPSLGGFGTGVTLPGSDNARFLTGAPTYRLAFTSTNVSAMTYLHVDVYALNQSPWQFRLNDKVVTVSTPVNGWTSVNILLSDYIPSGLNLATVSYFDFFNPNGANPNSSYLDNIYFYRAATDTPPTLGALTVPTPQVLGNAPFTLTNPTSPSSGAWTYSSSPAGVVTFSGNTATIVGGGTTTITATQAAVPGVYGPASTSASLVVTYPAPGPSPVPPVRDPAKVVSMFTGTPPVYANAITAVRASWTGGTTMTTIPNGTNTCLQLDNFGYLGLVASAGTFSVVGMTNLHVDVYLNSPISNMFVVLVSTAPDKLYNTGALVAGWNSLDINLSSFPAGATLSALYGLKFEQNVGVARQIYIDNVYFDIPCYTPTATIVSNGGDFCPGSNATFTVNGTEGSTLDYTITGQVGTQQLALTGANQTITAVNPSGDVTLNLLTVTNASCLTTTSSSTFATGSSSVAKKVEINFNNLDDDCDGSKFNGHDAVVVDITSPAGTLATMQDPIGCSEATNTTPYFEAPQVTYKFKITKTNAPTSVAYVTSEFLGFYFDSASNAAHSSTYDVQATAIVNGEEQPYNGNTVTFTSPAAPTISNPPTQAGPPNVACAYTLPRIDSYIYANNTTTYGANRYEFLVERMNGAAVVQTVSVTTTTPYFKLTNIVGVPTTMQVTYGTTYRIKVRYGYAGATSFGSQIYTAFGSECLVSTPSLPVASVPCGITLASVNAFIYASGFAAGASQFEFKVTRVSTQQPGELPIGTTEETLVRNVANFKLTMLTSLFVGLQKEYKVSVRYTVTAYGSSNVSSWSSLLTPCSLYTPDFPETTIVESQCGVVGVPSSVNQYVYATGVPGATQYRFRLYNAVDAPYTAEAPYDQFIDSPNNYIKLNQFPSLIANVAYSVTVVAQLYGEYANIDLAKDCSITAPQSTPPPSGPAKTVIASVFQASAYPNPFANNFMIAVKTGSQSVVNLKVYDMIGRLIEQRESTVSDMETTTIGDRYPSGVYNVVVSQQDEVQTLRVVKR